MSVLGSIGQALTGIFGGGTGAEDAASAAQEARFKALGEEMKRFRGIAPDARYNELRGQLDMYAPLQQYAAAMFPNIAGFKTQDLLDRFKQTTDALKPISSSQLSPSASAQPATTSDGTVDAIAAAQAQAQIAATQARIAQAQAQTPSYAPTYTPPSFGVGY